MNIKKSVFTFCIALASVVVNAQSNPTKEMTDAMTASAKEWNKGNLDTFISIYESSATMMYPNGPVGMEHIKDLYRKNYFKADGLPKQNLKYSDIKVRMLGTDYALLTGAFTLYGNKLADHSGRYSLVMHHTAKGWKILHDHSS